MAARFSALPDFLHDAVQDSLQNVRVGNALGWNLSRKTLEWVKGDVGGVEIVASDFLPAKLLVKKCLIDGPCREECGGRAIRRSRNRGERCRAISSRRSQAFLGKKCRARAAMP